MKLFKKKFKVRVVHFGECKYSVEWVYYRFLPIYIPLRFWYGPSHPGGGLQRWSIDLFSVKQAEEIAESLKNIEDVREYYKPLNEKAAVWRKNEAQYWKDHGPYKVKNF